MRTLILARQVQNDFATYGELTDGFAGHIAFTLELPWRDNAHDVSCIPAGTYEAFAYMSPKRGYIVFKLRGVPDRDNIEMHKGDLPRDTDGCILLGEQFGDVDYNDGKPGAKGFGLLKSKDAFDRFMEDFAGIDSFMLTVVDVPTAAVAA